LDAFREGFNLVKGNEGALPHQLGMYLIQSPTSLALLDFLFFQNNFTQKNDPALYEKHVASMTADEVVE
jgi:hypothetical protein